MSVTPRQLIEQINAVSDEFFELSQEAASIAERKGTAWLEIRCSWIDKNGKPLTNAETVKLWEASPDGRREAYLKIYLRGLQAKRGALILEHKMNQGIV
jgi:hypothetical protein